MASPQSAPLMSSKERLSIYDEPAKPIVLVPDAPSSLQLQISSVRQGVQSVHSDLSTKARSVSSQWIGAEHKLEHELGSIRARDEPLTPGVFYIGISTLFGSILTRNRFLPLRLVAPPVFLAVSSLYFLPKNTERLASWTRAFEEANAPALYRVHQSVSNTLQEYKKAFINTTRWSSTEADDFISRSREKLQSATGFGQLNGRSSNADDRRP